MEGKILMRIVTKETFRNEVWVIDIESTFVSRVLKQINKRSSMLLVLHNEIKLCHAMLLRQQTARILGLFKPVLLQ